MKLYTTYWEQQGTGTSIDFDNDAFPNGIYDNDLEVARIYLEFCELGDMASWAKSTYPYVEYLFSLASNLLRSYFTRLKSYHRIEFDSKL